ncbi:alpha/beta hydrolase [Paenibacillus cremeus]|nr:alpha/beta hydrolase [Paenibacillus cremeus]
MRYVDSCFSEIEVRRDIAFTEAVNNLGELEKLKLDVYMPQGDTLERRPAILWVHGGGFRPGNDKSQSYIVTFAERFAQKGYVCVSADYRVREQPGDDFQGTMSDALADVTQALEWIRANGSQYGIDTERLFIAGGSAGGMISVNLCYGDGSYGTQADLSGVIGMLNLWGTPGNLKLALHSGSIPVLTVHGTADQLVSIENSYRLIEQLKHAGVPHVFIPLEGAPHTPVKHVDELDEAFSQFLHGILAKL